jgi:hypothetical protein
LKRIRSSRFKRIACRHGRTENAQPAAAPAAAMDDKSIKYDSDGEILQINFKVNYSKKRDVLRRLVFMQNGGKWFILQDRLD